MAITYGISIEVCNNGVHNSGMRKGISASDMNKYTRRQTTYKLDIFQCYIL